MEGTTELMAKGLRAETATSATIGGRRGGGVGTAAAAAVRGGDIRRQSARLGEWLPAAVRKREPVGASNQGYLCRSRQGVFAATPASRSLLDTRARCVSRLHETQNQRTI